MRRDAGFSSKFLIRVSSLVIQVPRYDPGKLVQKLTAKCTTKTSGSSFFDWKMLGKECGICFNSLPERVSFLYGVIDDPAATAHKQRKARRKRTDEDEEVEEVEPETVKNKSDDGDNSDKLSAMEKLRKQVEKKLRKVTHNKVKESETRDATVDGVKFLFNPNSFTQTVENIFTFSFLVKRGLAEIGVRNESSMNQPAGLYVRSCIDQGGDEEVENPPSTQAVCSFTMKDWREICKAHKLMAGDLPHRSKQRNTGSE
jgi:hypothetical protein